MAGMEFHVSFLVDEEHLGPVMAALYRVGDITQLSMTPVVEIEHPLKELELKTTPEPNGGAESKEPPQKRGPYKKADASKGASPIDRRRGRGPGGAKVADLILAKMSGGEALASEDMLDIIRKHGYSAKGLYSCLDRLVKNQRITKISPGVYRLSKASEKEKGTT